MGIFGNLQSAYAPLESWFYDRYIASQLFSTMPVAEVEATPIPTLPIVLLKARKKGALK